MLDTLQMLSSADVQDIKGKVNDCGTNIGQWPAEAREVLLRYLVHTADITNPIRPSPLAHEWSRRIMQEFYAQVCPLARGCVHEQEATCTAVDTISCNSANLACVCACH